MQYQKEEVRTAILEAATEEFYEYGYEKASLRGICARANISVGNLYRYFENREKLFEEIVGGLYNGVMFLLKEKIFVKDSVYDMHSIADVLAKSFLSNYHSQKRRFVILFEKSEGSRFEGAREEVSALVKDRIRQEYFPARRDAESEFVCDVLAGELLNGIFRIVHANLSGEQSKRMLETLFVLCFEGREEQLERLN